jgi:hypothetical protein
MSGQRRSAFSVFSTEVEVDDSNTIKKLNHKKKVTT